MKDIAKQSQQIYHEIYLDCETLIIMLWTTTLKEVTQITTAI